LPIAITEAAILGCFLLLISGWGAFLPRQLWCSEVCKTAADFISSGLLFAALYVVTAQAAVPTVVAILGTAVFLVAGAAGLLLRVRTSPRAVVLRVEIALAAALYWVLTSDVSGNRGAIDPRYYVASPYLLFSPDWVAANVVNLPDGVAVQAGIQMMALTRAAAAAILWPLAAAGLGLGVGHVAQAGIGLLVVTAALSAGLTERGPPLWLGLLLGVGGAGIYNVISVLSGGQIQQAMALAVGLACTWLASGSADGWQRALPFGIGGFIVAATYPEFLVVMPLYVVVVALVHQHTPAMTAWLFIGLGVGFVAEQALTQGGSLGYVLNQSGASPGWAPLPFTPGTPVDALREVILQTRPPLVLLPFVLALSALYLLRYRRPSVAQRVPLHVVLVLGGLAIVWAVVIARSPNLNYAVFKLSGWVGPGLLLVGWWFAGAAAEPLRQGLRTLVVGLAVARLCALVYGSGDVLAFGRPDLAAEWPRLLLPDGRCAVRVDVTEAARTLGAIAGSAAPFHDCALLAE
jgi:hypothetical protein